MYRDAFAIEQTTTNRRKINEMPGLYLSFTCMSKDKGEDVSQVCRGRRKTRRTINNPIRKKGDGGK